MVTNTPLWGVTRFPLGWVVVTRVMGLLLFALSMGMLPWFNPVLPCSRFANDSSRCQNLAFPELFKQCGFVNLSFPLSPTCQVYELRLLPPGGQVQVNETLWGQSVRQGSRQMQLWFFVFFLSLLVHRLLTTAAHPRCYCVGALWFAAQVSVALTLALWTTLQRRLPIFPWLAILILVPSVVLVFVRTREFPASGTWLFTSSSWEICLLLAQIAPSIMSPLAIYRLDESGLEVRLDSMWILAGILPVVFGQMIVGSSFFSRTHKWEWLLAAQRFPSWLVVSHCSIIIAAVACGGPFFCCLALVSRIDLFHATMNANDETAKWLATSRSFICMRLCGEVGTLLAASSLADLQLGGSILATIPVLLFGYWVFPRLEQALTLVTSDSAERTPLLTTPES